MFETFYAKDGNERVGFIFDDESVIEVDNISESPSNSFDVRTEDLLLHATKAVASWHTHPNGSSNLSPLDYDAFKAWPDMKHYIVGNDGVSCYIVDPVTKKVLKDAS